MGEDALSSFSGLFRFENLLSPGSASEGRAQSSFPRTVPRQKGVGSGGSLYRSAHTVSVSVNLDVEVAFHGPQRQLTGSERVGFSILLLFEQFGLSELFIGLIRTERTRGVGPEKK
jgi:hypothetical protein